MQCSVTLAVAFECCRLGGRAEHCNGCRASVRRAYTRVPSLPRLHQSERTLPLQLTVLRYVLVSSFFALAFVFTQLRMVTLAALRAHFCHFPSHILVISQPLITDIQSVQLGAQHRPVKESTGEHACIAHACTRTSHLTHGSFHE